MNETPALETVERSTADEVDASVVWLHGLGADGTDFLPVVPEMRRAAQRAGIRFVFPHAPVQPVTLNGGMSMRAWFDLRSLDPEGLDDAEGLARAADAVERLMEREADRGVPAERLFLAGFSQGAATALYTALSTARPLAGLMALSGWLPRPSRLDGAPRFPIFMAHGSQDPVVQVDWGRESARRLEAEGFPVLWNEYAMPHAVCPEEIAAIDAWLAERLAP